MLEIIITLVTLVANWQIFRKLGRQGWEGIIPIYNTYVLFDELYGNGWKMFLLLIPIYNIYLIFKLYIDLAAGFHLGAGFGVGLVLLSPIFLCILAFGSYVYGDGSQVVNAADPISETIDSAASFVNDAVSGKNRRDPDAAQKLEQLKSLYDSGILTEEEYQKKRSELLERL